MSFSRDESRDERGRWTVGAPAVGGGWRDKPLFDKSSKGREAALDLRAAARSAGRARTTGDMAVAGAHLASAIQELGAEGWPRFLRGAEARATSANNCDGCIQVAMGGGDDNKQPGPRMGPFSAIQGEVDAAEAAQIESGQYIVSPDRVLGPGSAPGTVRVVLNDGSVAQVSGTNVSSGAGGFYFHLELELQENTGFGGGRLTRITRGPINIVNEDPSLPRGNQQRYQVNFADEFGKVTNYSVNYDPGTGQFGIIKPSSGPKR